MVSKDVVEPHFACLVLVCLYARAPFAFTYGLEDWQEEKAKAIMMVQEIPNNKVANLPFFIENIVIFVEGKITKKKE